MYICKNGLKNYIYKICPALAQLAERLTVEVNML